MSCRSTPSGSAFTTYARLATGSRLTDPQTLSVFHELQSIYRHRDEDTRRVYTQDEYEELLTRQIRRVEGLGDISDARRESILERLRTAQGEDMPDQAIVYGLHNLTPTLRKRSDHLDEFYRDIANRMEIPLDEVKASFAEFCEAGSGRPRQVTYSSENRALSSRLGLGRKDAGIVHAVAMLTEQANHVELARIMAAPPRIETTVPVGGAVEGTFLVLDSFGYDGRNGRLEVTVSNTHSGETSTSAYQNVPAHVVSDLVSSGERAGNVWSTLVRGNPRYTYESEHDALRDGRAPRCPDCGQYAGTSHVCTRRNASPPAGQAVPGARTEPVTLTTASGSRGSWQEVTFPEPFRPGYSETTFRVRLPSARSLREAVLAGPVTIGNINEYVDLNPGDVRDTRGRCFGSVTVTRGVDAPVFETSMLRCSCAAYHRNGTCPHIDVVLGAVRTRLGSAATGELTQADRDRLIAAAQRRAESAARTDWTRSEETLAEARRTWAAETEVVYSEDYAEFERVYRSAAAARETVGGTPLIPFQRVNALNGLATRESGNGFGMEIEYEFPQDMDYPARNAAQERIGRELYEAGLTYSQSQQGYGASRYRAERNRGNGPADTHERNWSWEDDGSVNGGELVTPIMYDEATTWANLETAVDILKRNGAVASKAAGAHVHVGTSHFGRSPERYAELARLMSQHEDVMYRLASDPARGTHRGGHYASPNPAVAPAGFSNMNQVRQWQDTRSSALNLLNVSGTTADHVEFRVFDSTLDVGAMQTQIKVAVAMTHAAPRIASGGATRRKKEELGAHAKRNADPSDSDALKADTATFRSLLDTLFTRKADKDQAVTLFANTKWNKPQRY